MSNWSGMIEDAKNQATKIGNDIYNEAMSKIPKDFDISEASGIQDMGLEELTGLTEGGKEFDISNLTSKDINIGGQTISLGSIKGLGKKLKFKDDPTKGMSIETPGRSFEIAGQKFNINSIKLNDNLLNGQGIIDLDGSDISMDEETGKKLMEQFTGGKSMEDIQNADFDNMSPEEVQAKVEEMMSSQNNVDDIGNVADGMNIKFDKGLQDVLGKFNLGKF